jgi:hypothetical protein
MSADQANDDGKKLDQSHQRNGGEDDGGSPSKAEDLTKAGRKDFDPNEGSD